MNVWYLCVSSTSMTRTPRIAVVGSCNADVVAFVDRAPERGETVAGLRSTVSSPVPALPM